MPKNWSEGFTKETHLSVKKISTTMKLKKIDNFSKWREKMKAEGKMRSTYPPFEHSEDLAELIGVLLGDGHLSKFPRSEELTLVSNSNNPGFVSRYSRLFELFFEKTPLYSKGERQKLCSYSNLPEKNKGTARYTL